MRRPYNDRTVDWGHWGISFFRPNPDARANFGLISGYLPFGVGTRGPIDAAPGMHERYRAMCQEWLGTGVLPAGAFPQIAPTKP